MTKPYVPLHSWDMREVMRLHGPYAYTVLGFLVHNADKDRMARESHASISAGTQVSISKVKDSIRVLKGADLVRVSGESTHNLGTMYEVSPTLICPRRNCSNVWSTKPHKSVMVEHTVGLPDEPLSSTPLKRNKLVVSGEIANSTLDACYHKSQKTAKTPITTLSAKPLRAEQFQDNAPRGRNVPPTLAECEERAVDIGMPRSEGEAFFYRYDSTGWRSQGAAVTNWHSLIYAWKSNARNKSHFTLPLINPSKADCIKLARSEGRGAEAGERFFEEYFGSGVSSPPDERRGWQGWFKGWADANGFLNTCQQ